ncbi:ricin-type beta-trefoil lectin domain protein [Streptomyces sp. NPDC101181]|uniref:RICIN domain-containing protein n=1 Tax=Streptomyces sp. NPDC101181 TaxID=3366125 RepID=UPI0038193939
MAGAVLIGVPVVVLGMSDDDRRSEQWVSSEPVGGTPLEPNMSDDKPPADYVVESPSPSAAPTAPKKVAPEPVVEKQAPVVEAQKEPVKKEQAAPEKEVEKPPALTPRQLANAVSTRVNVLLKNKKTGLCVDVPGEAKGKSAGKLQQYTCKPSAEDNQIFDLKVVDKDGGPQGSSLFLVKNRKSGLCLDVSYYTTVKPGAVIMEYRCDGTKKDNQLWWLDPNEHGHRIRNVVSNNMCMGVAGGDGSKIAALMQLQTCSDQALSSQRWIVNQII